MYFIFIAETHFIKFVELIVISGDTETLNPSKIKLRFRRKIGRSPTYRGERLSMFEKNFKDGELKKN